ncbi:MAG: 3-oxoacyl-[acyl-carrier-protein] synthase III [Mariniblastus sp.]|jgi:3-oxoacyl-[acyl-carrier-protein] synthase III
MSGPSKSLRPPRKTSAKYQKTDFPGKNQRNDYLMQYSDVCLESFGYTLPEEIWTSSDVEQKLKPLYERLKLPEGRLELMTGIRERRFWPRETPPSDLSVSSCELALEAAGFDPGSVGCLIHGSVCRDFLEPATACTVHHQVGLPRECFIFDVSNACLGLLTGIVQAANMIQLGQIKSALVVGSEGGRQLVENTIKTLNHDATLTRKSIKSAVASLTIGSASCAVLLTHSSISETNNRLIAAAVNANTQYHDLCQSHNDQAGADMQPLMKTDSEKLMRHGVETGVATMGKFLEASQWSLGDIDRAICHQVGIAHQKLMLQALGVNPELDFSTFPWLGNTGSAALPITMAVACEKEFIQPGDNVAMLGIGSGINCMMLAVNWQKTQVASRTWTSSHPGT